MKTLAGCALTIGMIFCGSAIDSAVETPMNFGIYLLIFGATMAAAWVLAHGRHVRLQRPEDL